MADRIIKLKIDTIINEVQELRNNLYYSLPTGDVTAWQLIQVTTDHIKKLDKLIESYKQ